MGHEEVVQPRTYATVDRYHCALVHFRRMRHRLTGIVCGIADNFEQKGTTEGISKSEVFYRSGVHSRVGYLKAKHACRGL